MELYLRISYFSLATIVQSLTSRRLVTQVYSSIFFIFTLVFSLQAHSVESEAFGNSQNANTLNDDPVNIGFLQPQTELTESFLNQSQVVATEINHPELFKKQDIIVINSAYPLSSIQREWIIKAYHQEKILFFDQWISADMASVDNSVTAQLVGIGLTDTLILVRKSLEGVPEFKAISSANHSRERSNRQALVQSAWDALTEWLSDQQKTPNQRITPQNSSGNRQNYRPETTLPMEFRRISIPCTVGDDFQGNGFTHNATWKGEIEDACQGKASVALLYTLDFVRSVPFQGGGQLNADNSKYLRITYDPKSSGGAGWHLVDKPRHKHSWFQSWANRIDWFGPIAMQYGVEISSKDPNVRLFHNTPDNSPLQRDIREVSGLSVGVDGGGKVDFGEKGPNVGLDATASFSYNSSRWVSYKTHEYEIRNLSNRDTAKWVWDRNFNAHASNWRSHNVAPLWSTSWFFNENLFSPAAYANYKPGFSATFRVEGDYENLSTFNLTNSVNIVALSGRVQYSGVVSVYEPYAYMGTHYDFKKQFIINWDAPVFQPEINVSLEAFAYDSSKGLCISAPSQLNVESSNFSEVELKECLYTNEQLWGLDSMQRYRSRAQHHPCLTLTSEGKLKAQACTASASQKWRWQGDQLINETGRKIIINSQKVLSSAALDSNEYDRWRNYTRKVSPEKVINFSKANN